MSYHIPFPRNKRFTGRSTELEKMEHKLFATKDCQRLAVVGLGGVGKTQLALEFAYTVKENRSNYSIFWMPALSMEIFEQACAGIVRRLGIAQVAEGKEDMKELVKQHLSGKTSGQWLLIVDNADDKNILFGSERIDSIADYLPQSEQGLVVFTTRTREVAVALARQDLIELQTMSQQEALDFLRTSLIRKHLLGDDSVMTELLHELTCLPLAIAQAAAYLNINEISIAEYLRLLRSTERDTISLLSREFHDDTRYKGSKNAVATTWLVSFNQILEHDPTAADLLSFMSCIEPKAIPQSMLPTADLEEQLVHAIGTLCAYALVVRRADHNAYDLHRLVHVAAKSWLRAHGLEAEKTEKAIEHVTEVFPVERLGKPGIMEGVPPAYAEIT